MIVILEKNNAAISIQTEEDDIPKTYHIMEMMKSEGWREYKKYQEQIRNSLIEIGKDSIMKKSTRELAENKWAMIYGSDLMSGFQEVLIEGVDKLIKFKQNKLKEKQEEDQNDD